MDCFDKPSVMENANAKCFCNAICENAKCEMLWNMSFDLAKMAELSWMCLGRAFDC